MNLTWGGAGSVASVDWGGRSWTLDLAAQNPGLLCQEIGPLLALSGLASSGRRDPSAFSFASLRNVERRFGRIEATYMPDGWGDLQLRASWKLHEAGVIDLEIQLSAQSVDELRQLEVFVSSSWSHARPQSEARWVEPRDAHAASLSYDGRETNLETLTTLPPTGAVGKSPRIHLADSAAYLEMVHPDDVTRRICIGSPSADLSDDTLYGLFGLDLEKGVVLRGRLRGAWVPVRDQKPEAIRRMNEFLNEPPPLGP
jgi:hypothetical protein